MTYTCNSAHAGHGEEEREKEGGRKKRTNERVGDSIDLEDASSHEPTSNRGSLIFTYSATRRTTQKYEISFYGSGGELATSHLDKI